jgi:hypothetical protein
MQVTLTIPDELAEQLIAAGKDPSRAALEALTNYQRLLDLAAEADASEGIRQGLDELNRGEGRPATEFFAEMRKKYALSR